MTTTAPLLDPRLVSTIKLVTAEKLTAEGRKRAEVGFPHFAANSLREAAHALYEAADALTNEAGERESMTAKEVA